MPSSPPKFRLALHPTGLWEASALVDGREMHFGFFAERAEAERTLDTAKAHYGGEAEEPEEAERA
jgi:hypothetical protein